MKERETLIRLEDAGEVLVLLDGRRLRVRPEDIFISRTWIPMEELEISDASTDPMYTVIVRDVEEKQDVLARWI